MTGSDEGAQQKIEAAKPHPKGVFGTEVVQLLIKQLFQASDHKQSTEELDKTRNRCRDAATEWEYQLFLVENRSDGRKKGKRPRKKIRCLNGKERGIEILLIDSAHQGR
jgi:hypothetical protein